MLRLIAFDIDGTLTRKAGAFDGLFARAIQRTLSISMHQRWSAYQHSTDSGILAEIVERALGRPPTLHEVDAVQECYFQTLEEMASRAEASPGAQQALDAVARHTGFAGCFVTGNWRRAAELKLAGAGLSNPGFPIYSADDSVHRSRILSHAADNTKVPPEQTVYLGDAPWDERAAREAGVRFVAVVHAGDRFRAIPKLARVHCFGDLSAFWQSIEEASVPELHPSVPMASE